MSDFVWHDNRVWLVTGSWGPTQALKRPDQNQIWFKGLHWPESCTAEAVSFTDPLDLQPGDQVQMWTTYREVEAVRPVYQHGKLIDLQFKLKGCPVPFSVFQLRGHRRPSGGN